jgi:peptidoglycan/LPS O-acetylase OafA/YrhL
MPRRYLDLLRTLAILAVFATHVLLFCPPAVLTSLVVAGHNVSWLLIGPAWGGVWVFFVLAGYLVGKGFMRGSYALTWPGCRRFWWNRFLRICVPYYFAVFVVVVLTAPQLLDMSGWSTLARMLTFTYYDTSTSAPLGQTWYVSTLVQLMVVAPLLALLLSPLLRRPRAALLAIILVLAAGTLVRVAPLLLYPGSLMEEWWPSWMYVPVWANVDVFVAGYLVNAFAGRPESVQARSPRRLPVLIAFAAVWVATAWLAYHGLTLDGQTSGKIFAFGGPLVWTAVAAWWIVMAEARPTPASAPGFIRGWWWVLVEAAAALSYGMYIWHVPILQSVSTAVHATSPMRAWAITFFGGLTLTVAMAAVVRGSVERAASRWRHDPPRKLVTASQGAGDAAAVSNVEVTS